jgi:hypothetical protein
MYTVPPHKTKKMPRKGGYRVRMDVCLVATPFAHVAAAMICFI